MRVCNGWILTSAFNGWRSSTCPRRKLRNPRPPACARSEYKFPRTGTFPRCSFTELANNSFSSIANRPTETSTKTLGPIAVAASRGKMILPLTTSKPPLGAFTVPVNATSVGGSTGAGFLSCLLEFGLFAWSLCNGVSASARRGWPVAASC